MPFYAEHEAEIDIATATIKQSALPRRARALAVEWAEAHRDELFVNWQLARFGQPLNLIPPLE
jgi:hypothetical protein